MKIAFGSLLLLQRVYVMLMLFNSDIKTNIFSWVYLFLSMYFFWWSKNSKQLQTVSSLNQFSILLVQLQYIFLLLNITSNTSPIIIPAQLLGNKTMSLVNWMLLNVFKFSSTKAQSCSTVEWVNYLGFGGYEQFGPGGEVCNMDNNNSDNFTFVVNAVIIFLIVLYFSFFVTVARYIINTIHQKSKERNYMIQNKFFLNFKSWRSGTYVFFSAIYDGFLIYGHIMIALLIILLTGSNDSIFNLLIMMACLWFIFRMEFLMPWPYRITMQPHVIKFYEVLKICILFIIMLYSAIKVPTIGDYLDNCN